MEIFQKWITRILYNLGLVLIVLLITTGTLLITILALEIGSRAFLGKSILWVQELSTLLLTFMTAIGASIMFINNEEVRITFIADLFSKRIQHGINIIGNMLILFLSINLIIGSLKFKPIVSRSAFNVLSLSTGINAIIMLIFSIILFLCSLRDILSNTIGDETKEKENNQSVSIISEY